MGTRLSDVHISRAQQILKHQFFYLNGLESSLYQDKDLVRSEEMVKNKVQIVYCKDREHWIVASTVNKHIGEVLVVDSVFNSLDNDTRKTITNLFKYTGSTGKLNIKLARSQKQRGGDDCGLFAIAFATAIALGKSPMKIKIP